MNTQALSASTEGIINGNGPYLTFDNGVTKVTTTDGLLGITLSDGTTQTTYTPVNNTSTAENPIVLPVENQSFADIGMLVPSTVDSIALSELIGAPYNYWGDDDGDGQGANGITASGSLSVSITDNTDNKVSRNTVLSICNAPYKVTLSTTDGSLTTQYGVPNSSSFSDSSATYYINPKATPVVCYARPNLAGGFDDSAGPANIWNIDKGFLVQSTESSSYSRNFPTTGANNLHFDLLVGGLDAAKLTWPAVTLGGITATMTVNPPVDWYFNPDGASSVRVTLTGPVATIYDQQSNYPSPLDTLTLPQTFELVGYDSNNKAVLKYGFVLKQWFISRGFRHNSYVDALFWCNSIGGYRLPQVKDLTNAKCGTVDDIFFPCINGVDGAAPLSSGNYFQRNIGAGFFTEWGKGPDYTSADFGNYTFFVDIDGWVNGNVSVQKDGLVNGYNASDNNAVICVYP